MEKQKRWQFYLILAVIVLTLYNILPTVFYYTQPLKEPIGPKQAEAVALQIVDRVDELEHSSKEWLYSFCRLLGITPEAITFHEKTPYLFEVSFKKERDAALFRQFLPESGKQIPFVPAQLSLEEQANSESSNTVSVVRRISVHLDPSEVNSLFLFSPIRESDGSISDLYRKIVYDRFGRVALALTAPSQLSSQIQAIVKQPENPEYDEVAISIAEKIVDASQTFKNTPEIMGRYFASLIQTAKGQNVSAQLIKVLEGTATRIKAQQKGLLASQSLLSRQEMQLEAEEQQRMLLLQKQAVSLDSAIAVVKKNLTPSIAKTPFSTAEIVEELNSPKKELSETAQTQRISLKGRNPFFEALEIDWNANKIAMLLYPDVEKLRTHDISSDEGSYLSEKTSQYVINEVARVSQQADENIESQDSAYTLSLNTLNGTKSFLALNLGYIAEKQKQEILSMLQTNWEPEHIDLLRNVFPIRSFKEFKALSPEEQKLGLVLYAPAADTDALWSNFRPGSIYVVAKGLDAIIQKYREMPNAADSSLLLQDIEQLISLLQRNGFIVYSGASYGPSSEFAKDYIFELPHYYENLVDATRENFYVKGSKQYAILDFTDVEQRILALNKIEDLTQEDLLKWRESYNNSLVSTDKSHRYLVPAPTKNPFLENWKIDFKKYFRGDDRKILKWGLDLSGGKTIRIGLRDRNNQPVTNHEDLQQAVNELYARINKMGVSERTIHIENDNIVLDFPGSQALSASDLVRASAMYFHIVNEKFTPHNAALKSSIDEFLQNVWNEAIVTNRKDIESLNEIAWQHLGGENSLEEMMLPRSEAAKTLYDNGLRLANPKNATFSHAFNDTLSTIGVMNEEDALRNGQSYPLIVLFHNYAIEGANLNNVHAGYDPMKGNLLFFGVKSSYEGSGGSGSPQDDFYAWTSQFSENKIIGTPKEVYSKGNGWRMAVLLNGTIISMPTLQEALRDGGTISGRFSQREINQLVADLKAGSLSFTPKILSEENVSAELGSEERAKGIGAAIIAAISLVIAMISYYRFSGFIASCALLFNLLIMWGILQNLGAALSLPTIAGIVLTIGMAVDANVLVFERIREEFALSGKIASAIQAGYRKAFSAIVDSNITTVIAALILIGFDSGPIKGFAVALIVGIASSMFTALFMTRYFFAGWVQNPKNRELKMSQFFSLTHIDFLGQAKKAMIISGIIMILGGIIFFDQRHTLFGMDFTGGYALQLEVKEQSTDQNYRLAVTNALLAAGVSSNDIQIRELSRPNQLHIQLGMGMEEPGNPFYNMEEVTSKTNLTYPYQENPRLNWVVNTLENHGIAIPQSQLNTLQSKWTVMSGQFSTEMRNNAIIALGLALLSVLLYITLRFEFKYAIGAVVGLTHDVLISLGIFAFFHWIGFAIQIDIQVIGAIMTIIGYSLNDTIIVFDRIREDIRVLRKLPFPAVVSHALNVTLSRTVMTSGTTLLVLFSLVFFGGKSIFGFSLMMAIGILVGTFSSLYVASPIMIYFHNREGLKRVESSRSLRKA